MRVKVKVREQTFDIECGKGLQNLKWLSFVATRTYASNYPQYHYEQFSAINVRSPLYPQGLQPTDIVATKFRSGNLVIVDLIGPRKGPYDDSFRRLTLWEYCLLSPDADKVHVDIKIDLQNQSVAEVPVLTGSFNAWQERVPLSKRKTGVWGWSADLPAGMQLSFQFMVDGLVKLSDEYPVVKDEAKSADVNIYQVAHPASDDMSSSNALLSSTGTLFGGGFKSFNSTGTLMPGVRSVSRAGMDGTDGKDGKGRRDSDGKTQEKSKNPPLTHSTTQEEQDKMFELDWKEVQLHDVVRKEDQRLYIKEHAREHYKSLRNLFRYYSSQCGTDRMDVMNMVKFIQLCHQSKIPDSTVTVTRLSEIFRRVNVEEHFDEKKLQGMNNRKSLAGAMEIKNDPYNPNNMFVRGEFCEALVRIAIIKWKNLSPPDAFEKLLNEHVIAHAEDITKKTDLRALLSEDQNVRSLFEKYSKYLQKAFTRYAAADKSGPSDQNMSTMNLKEFKQLLQEFRLLDHALSNRAVFSAFALSQEEVADPSKESDLYEMIYPEFLEALVRLAHARCQSQPDQQHLPVGERVGRLFRHMFGDTEEGGKTSAEVDELTKMRRSSTLR